MAQDLATPARLRFASVLAALAVTAAAAPALASHDVPTISLHWSPDIGEAVNYRTVEHGFLEGGYIGCAAIVTLTFSNGARLPVTGVSFSQSRCQSGPAACEPYEDSEIVTECVQSPFPPQQEIVVPFHFEADIIEEPFGCIREIWLSGDLTGDDVEDTRSPPIKVVGDCD